ncbi:MAG: hypothetical protein ABIG89_02105 [Candidatus Woesearchaeota archaeon]
MDIIVSLILVFLTGVAGAFIGSMVGGGGLLTIPVLIFLGLRICIICCCNHICS